MVEEGRMGRHLLLKTLVVVSSVWFSLLLCEWLLFVALAGIRCDEEWQVGVKVADLPNKLTGVVVSDIHVLGTERHSWLDRKWIDRQLWNGLRGSSTWYRPDVVLSLGDTVDEGHTNRRTEWDDYVDRFFRIVREDPSADGWENSPGRQQQQNLWRRGIYGTVGNRDTGAVGGTQKATKRFEESFGKVNDIVRMPEFGIEFVKINAMALDKCSKLGENLALIEADSLCVDVSTFLKDLKEASDLMQQDISAKPLFRVLLLHMPLYRMNDLECGGKRLLESRHQSYTAPSDPLEVGKDVLSGPVSNYLVQSIDPDLVLSGHTHTQCYRIFPENENHRGVTEVTVPTFNWRMRPDPSYAILRLRNPTRDVSVQICRLPHEYNTIALYVLVGIASGLLSLGLVIKRLERQQPSRDMQKRMQ